jgi:hypothetical protein
VILEALLDENGQLRWKNHATGAQSGFEWAVMRYNTNGRIHVDDPAKLKIFPFRDEIARLANVTTADASRFRWGYYRHRAETAHLIRVQSAFLRAQREGSLHFDPSKRDRIEVRWGRDGQGKPELDGARFVPENGPAVDLPLK